MNQPPFNSSSNSKPTPSVMRQVGIAMLALGTLTLAIGFVIASLVN
jgi:hypothetical protein